MKILILSWEYPPKNIGGISEHVHHLCNEMACMGLEIHIITSMADNALENEFKNGVYIHRVNALNIDTQDFTKWVMHLNYSIIERGIKLIEEIGSFDIIHAHDWLCTYSSCILKGAYKIPMVSTIHATENGRNGGIWTEMQRYISQVEWKLCFEAWKIIVCSNCMKGELKELFNVPDDKIWVIPNGVPIRTKEVYFDTVEFRSKYAEENQKIVYYVGRHVYEKGIHLLIDGASRLLSQNQNIKFIIAGAGPMSYELKEQVKNCGLEKNFYFTGFIDNDTKNKLYAVADVAVFPSLYEPFGIVALEAMEAGCPVVVTETGGFNEIIQNGENGLKAYSNSPESIAWNINQIINNASLALKLKENGLKAVNEKYNWKFAADLTVDMYNEVIIESKKSVWI